MSKEVLLVVESVSNEKGVPAGVIFEALELALATATKKRFEDEVELRVVINRQTGSYETFRCWTVVEESDFDDPAHQVTTDMPRAVEANAKVGDVLEEKIESIEFGRIAAQTAKQVIVQKVREAERAQVVEAYRERLGEIISGTVKKDREATEKSTDAMDGSTGGTTDKGQQQAKPRQSMGAAAAGGGKTKEQWDAERNG